MQVKSTAECPIKRLSVLKTYFWSSFEWLLKTGFTVCPIVQACLNLFSSFMRYVITSYEQDQLCLNSYHYHLLYFAVTQHILYAIFVALFTRSVSF